MKCLCHLSTPDHRADAQGNYMNTENNMASAPVRRVVGRIFAIFLMGCGSIFIGVAIRVVTDHPAWFSYVVSGAFTYFIMRSWPFIYPPNPSDQRAGVSPAPAESLC